MREFFWAIGVITGLNVVALSTADATDDPALVCERAIDTAEAERNIPDNILHAIALTETGQSVDGRLRPWPWVLNVGGNAVWFRTKAETLDHANELVAAGIANFDIGCFQINYRWHSMNFDSLNSMLDPETNALYAADFLIRKYAALGSWKEAVGAYHSATSTYADAYLARFQENYESISSFTVQTSFEVKEEVLDNGSTNTFPLLKLGNLGVGGSLVPSIDRTRPMFGELE
jgi:hypothetical protein